MILNSCEFELTSLEIVFDDSVGYAGLTPTINESLEWWETLMRFGEYHCRKLERLEILGSENKFPIESFLRQVSSLKLSKFLRIGLLTILLADQ